MGFFLNFLQNIFPNSSELSPEISNDKILVLKILLLSFFFHSKLLFFWLFFALNPFKVQLFCTHNFNVLLINERKLNVFDFFVKLGQFFSICCVQFVILHPRWRRYVEGLPFDEIKSVSHYFCLSENHLNFSFEILLIDCISSICSTFDLMLVFFNNVWVFWYLRVCAIKVSDHLFDVPKPDCEFPRGLLKLFVLPMNKVVDSTGFLIFANNALNIGFFNKHLRGNKVKFKVFVDLGSGNYKVFV